MSLSIIAIATGILGLFLHAAPIPANSLFAHLMSLSWKSNIGIRVIAYIQSCTQLLVNALTALL